MELSWSGHNSQRAAQAVRSKPHDILRSNLRRALLLVVLFTLLPAILLITVVIVALALGHYQREKIIGWSTMALALTLVAGVLVTVWYVRRTVSVARLQTEFVNKVSHDLRTPLTSIRLFVETLQGGRVTDPETVQQALALIAQETGRLSAQINRLLGWARMEAGRRSYQLNPVAPGEVLDRALQAFEARQLLGKVRIVREDGPDVPMVRVDVDAMTEVLSNLLENAYRYTGEDKHIRVGCARRAVGPIARVAFFVQDNGPGIAKKEHRRIFEKFYRVAAQESDGSGLGLAIVYHIVRAHGGSVAVDSEVGKGATFTVLLPASE